MLSTLSLVFSCINESIVVSVDVLFGILVNIIRMKQASLRIRFKWQKTCKLFEKWNKMYYMNGDGKSNARDMADDKLLLKRTCFNNIFLEPESPEDEEQRLRAEGASADIGRNLKDTKSEGRYATSSLKHLNQLKISMKKIQQHQRWTDKNG